MKVRELVEKLQALPQDLDAYVQEGDSPSYAYRAVESAVRPAVISDDGRLAALLAGRREGTVLDGGLNFRDAMSDALQREQLQRAVQGLHDHRRRGSTAPVPDGLGDLALDQAAQLADRQLLAERHHRGQLQGERLPATSAKTTSASRSETVSPSGPQTRRRLTPPCRARRSRSAASSASCSTAARSPTTSRARSARRSENPLSYTSS